MPQDPKFGEKKPYTLEQKKRKGIVEDKKYTTCRLMKRLKSRKTKRGGKRRKSRRRKRRTRRRR